LYPLVGIDESPRPLITEKRRPIPAKPGQGIRYDYQDSRWGSCNIFMATEPLTGKRLGRVTEQRTKPDGARFMEEIAQCGQQAEQITTVTTLSDN